MSLDECMESTSNFSTAARSSRVEDRDGSGRRALDVSRPGGREECCVSGRREQTRDPCCRPAHANGGRSARTIRERVPKETQSDSEAAAENCNINRIESQWRARMLHRSWCQVTLVPTHRSEPGKARQRFLTCSTCVRAKSTQAAHECVWRDGGLQRIVGKMGCASWHG